MAVFLVNEFTSDLHSHMGYGLRIASNAVSHEFAWRMADEGVTVAEWVVMRIFYDVDFLSPILIASSMGMTRNAVSKRSEQLVAKGLHCRQARTCCPRPSPQNKCSFTSFAIRIKLI